MEASADRTVLIVDDSIITREILDGIFKTQYKVLQSCNGADALTLLRSGEPIDCVILDIVMPEMDGFDVLRAISADPELRKIPVVVVTAGNDIESEIKVLDLGAADLIAKPFEPRIVLHRVKNLIQRAESDRINEENRLYRQRLRQQEEIIRLTEFDDKTGIYNKQTFIRRASAMINEKKDKDFVIIRWDVDRFKVFNDTFGTAAGDNLLAGIGREYRNNAPAGMCYARIMADHFVFCCEASEFDERSFRQSVVTMLKALAPDFEFVPRFGAYVANDPSVDVLLMCDRALLALKAAKKSNFEGVMYYNESMRSALLEEQLFINEQRSAIENGEFIIYLQPQYNHATGAIIGAEALVRWEHPTRGLIPPGRFISVFERNGMIGKLDRYVWEKAVRTLSEWQQYGIPMIPISVNISRHDFYSPDFVESMVLLLAKYNVDVSYLHLEITETAYMEDPDQLVDAVEQLHKHGFFVEMDDFGSGYSSLNTLKDVPVDMIKLDMRFLGNGKGNPKSGIILNSIMRMTRWMGVSVIAEGVETVGQADFLRSIGCMYVQGYLYGKPMPIDEFEALMMTTDVAKEDAKKPVSVFFTDAGFWEPESLSTTIFNRLVGAAGVFEYCGKQVEPIRLNDAFTSMLSVGNDSGYIKNILTLLAPDCRRDFLAMLDKAAQTNGEAKCTVCIGTDNTEKVLSVTARVAARGTDRTVMYCIFDDITENSRLLEENSALNGRLSSLIESIPGGMISFSISDKIRIDYVNEIHCRMCGCTVAEYLKLYGDDATAAVHPDDRSGLQAKIVSVLTDPSQTLLHVYRHKVAGGYKWCEIKGRVIDSKDGVVRTCAIVTDIDDRVNSERERAELYEKMQVEIERNRLMMMRTGMYVFDYDTAADLMKEQSCGKHGELIDRDIEHYVASIPANTKLHPDSRPVIADWLTSCSTEKSGSVDFLFDGNGEGFRWSRAHFVRIFGADGKVVRVVGQVDDIHSERENALLAKSLNASDSEDYGGITEQIFNLLYESPDLKATINSILRVLGESYDVSRVYIFENSPDGKTCSNTYEWTAEGVTPQIDNLKDVPYDEIGGYIDLFDENGVFYCADSSLLCAPQRAILEPQGIKSMLQCSIKDGGKLRGFIGFDECRHIRDWTAAQRDKLVLVSRLLGSFVVKSKNDEERNDIGSLMKVFGSFNDFVYIVDPVSHLIVYSNDASVIKENFCYERLFAVDAPCEKCRLSECSDSGKAEIRRSPDGRWMLTRCAPIRWEGKNLMLVLCTDITEYRESIESARLFNVTVSHISTGIFRAKNDDALTIVYANNIMRSMLSDKIAFCEFLSEEASKNLMYLIRSKTTAGEQMPDFETTVTLADSSSLTLLIKCAYLPEINEIVGTVIDISSLAHVREKLRVSELELRLAISHMGRQICRYDVKTDTLTLALSYADKHGLGVTEIKVSELLKPNARISTDDTSRIREFFDGIRDGSPSAASEASFRLPDGSICHERGEYATIYDANGEPVSAIITIEDITKEREDESALISRASTDFLTGLCNRASFEEQFDALCRRGGTHALMMLDLDGFKKVNDRYGHLAGDNVLREVSSRMSGLLRKSDVIGRFGGDEFVIALSDVHDDRAVRRLAKRICESLEIEYDTDAHITASIGIAMFPEQGSCFAEMYPKADAALYTVKNRGKNNFIFYIDEMSAESWTTNESPID